MMDMNDLKKALKKTDIIVSMKLMGFESSFVNQFKYIFFRNDVIVIYNIDEQMFYTYQLANKKSTR